MLSGVAVTVTVGAYILFAPPTVLPLAPVHGDTSFPTPSTEVEKVEDKTKSSPAITKNPSKTTPKPLAQSPAVKPITAVAPQVQASTTVVAKPITLPFSVTNFSNVAVWQPLLGDLSSKFSDYYNTNLLSLTSAANSTDGFAELSGSEDWKDYLYTAHLNFVSGTTFSLVARYKDSSNYAYCTFAQHGTTRINVVSGGKNSTVLQLTKHINSIPYVTGITYAVRVKGNEIECLVDNVPISANVTAMPTSGGIGVKSYNQVQGTGKILVQDIEVKAL